MIDARLQRALVHAVLEGVRHQLVQQRRHGDMRVVGDRIAQRQGAVSGQFGEKTIGERRSPLPPRPRCPQVRRRW